jgi:hypothetical protein
MSNIDWGGRARSLRWDIRPFIGGRYIASLFKWSERQSKPGLQELSVPQARSRESGLAARSGRHNGAWRWGRRDSVVPQPRTRKSLVGLVAHNCQWQTRRKSQSCRMGNAMNSTESFRTSYAEARAKFLCAASDCKRAVDSARYPEPGTGLSYALHGTGAFWIGIGREDSGLDFAELMVWRGQLY